METRIELITPAIAEMLLNNTEFNRKLKDSWVRELARIMKNNLWKESTGEAIKIDKSGKLLDGQHRLHALIRAEKSFKFLVAYDLDPSVFEVIDTGVRRSPGDMLTAQGIKDGGNIASIIRKYLILMQGVPNIRSHAYPSAKNNQLGFSNKEIKRIFDSSPEYWIEITKNAHSWYKASGRIMTTTEFGAFKAYFDKRNIAISSQFLNAVSLGTDLTIGNPVLALRRRLISSMQSSEKMTSSYRTQLVLKAFDFYYKGKSLTKLFL